MRLTIPDWGLILMIGASGAGKTTFARKHFRSTAILSSDHYRNVVGDDDRGRQTTAAAFEVMAEIAARRLEAKRQVVIDATNLLKENRRTFIDRARNAHAAATAIVLDPGERACIAHNARRPDPRPEHAVKRQNRLLRKGLKSLKREGFRRSYRIKSPDDIEEAAIETTPLSCNLRNRTGAFDIVGDVHACYDELRELLDQLGYEVTWHGGDGEPDGPSAEKVFFVFHPDSRTLVFTGDLVDRGPRNALTLQLVMDAVEHGDMLAVPGNHDQKMMRALGGRDVQRTHGLAETMAELEQTPEAFRNRVHEFVSSRPSHYELDEGRLVVAHAGMKEAFQGRTSRLVRDFALYGETTGETDEIGLPVRTDWARS